MQSFSKQCQNEILQLQVKLAFMKWHHDVHGDDIENLESIRNTIIEKKKSIAYDFS